MRSSDLSSDFCSSYLTKSLQVALGILMFDYKLLAALAAFVEQAGFKRAAQALGLSQSAISQRIKLLEARVGQPVLLRDTPPRPTELGQRLLNQIGRAHV